MSLADNGSSNEDVIGFLTDEILPHPLGNGHPRFFGWITRQGTAVMKRLVCGLYALLSYTIGMASLADTAVMSSIVAVRWLGNRAPDRSFVRHYYQSNFGDLASMQAALKPMAWWKTAMSEMPSRSIARSVSGEPPASRHHQSGALPSAMCSGEQTTGSILSEDSLARFAWSGKRNW